VDRQQIGSAVWTGLGGDALAGNLRLARRTLGHGNDILVGDYPYSAE
jgi:hypothetical protein